MSEPILTLDELEPERPLVAINHNAPDGPWQRFKYEHLEVLLRWMPVRFARTRELYPLRLPSEFGLQLLGRMEALRKELGALEGGDEDPATMTRIVSVLREMAGLVLDAPADVLDRLSPKQHAQIVTTFHYAVMGKTPTPVASANPPTSDASSPASAVSTALTPG